MNQRPTQTLAFWQSEFSVTDEAIEALYNSFLELGVPRSIDDIGLFFVQHALDAEERAIQAELQQGKVYRPDQRYAVDEQLVFPQFDYSLGRVTGVRPGYNPVEGEFVVMDVEFESPGKIRASFAAELKSPHALSDANGQAGGEDGLSAAQKIYGQFQYLIRPKIDAALRQNAEFVAFRTDWFLAGLLVEVQEGLLNIVDAAIDINTAPLNVDALIEQIDLLDKSPVNETLRFSVNYRLANDSRFINVGTDEHDLWYLNRLKPQQVMEVPHNLLINKDIAYDVATMPGEFRTLLAEIDDEASPVEYAKPVDPDSREALFVLTYPHRRCGTLPVLHSMQPLLPEANGRLLTLQFVDGQSGDEILVWYVSRHNYIYGLEEWFKKYALPVGAFIVLKKTDTPLKYVLDYVPQRAQREWIRVVTVQNDQLAFQMKKRLLSCRYDELMVIGEEGSETIDALWARVEQNKTPMAQLLSRIFPELMKLTSQSAVHVKTLYSAINVLRRCPPGYLLQELANHPSFVWMGHGYWTYKPASR